MSHTSSLWIWSFCYFDLWGSSDDLEKGLVYSWGKGQHGQLMHGKDAKYLPEPRLVSVSPVEPIKFIRAGVKSSFLVMEKGYLTSGNNWDYELGLATKGIYYEPKLVEISEQIIDLRVGAKHLVIKTKSQILVSGSN